MTLFLTFHLVGLFIWVSALVTELFTFYSKDEAMIQLRKKLWIYGVLPGCGIFTIGAIMLVLEEDYDILSEHWLLTKGLFLILLIVADVLIQMKREILAHAAPEVIHSFIRKMIVTILIAITGAVSLAMWHKENESKEDVSNTIISIINGMESKS